MSDGVGSVVVVAAAVLLGAAVLAASVRIVRGPSSADRVIALDMLGLLGVAAAGLAALASSTAAFMDIALGVALVGFLATMAFAAFIARGTVAPGDRK